MNLKEKLHKIYEAVDYIEKGGYNKSQSYSYIKAADVTHAIRKQLRALKIYAEINFDFVGASYTIARAKDKDAPFTAVNVRCSVIFHDLESNETLSASGLGSGADTGDKAAYKAQTGSLKYALKNAFLIPDDADPEADESTDEDNSRQYSQEPPDFQEARHAAPQVKKVEITRPAPPSAVALAKAFGPPLSGSAATEITEYLNPIEPKQTVTPTASEATREPGDDTDEELPTEEELNVFRSQFESICNNLSTQGKLKASKGLPLNRKVLVFMLQVEKASNAKELTKGQWSDFFKRAAVITSKDGGLIDLAKLVNKANGIEDTK